MVKSFTRKQLQEQLGFDAEETKIILEYQKKLPVLVENDDIEGFCVNARDLHIQLQVKRKFTDWIKRRLSSYNFKENLDFKPSSHKCEIANSGAEKDVTEYFLTIECAKQLSMVERTNMGEMTRRYFILMEKAVRMNLEWLEVRNPEKEGYKKLCSALNDYMIKLTGHDAIDWDYRFEANALNVICTGFEAQDIRMYLGCVDKITRDSLTKQYNEYLYKLQEMDIVYLGMGLNRYQRYEMLNKTFNILYPDAQPLFKNINIGKILENKNKLLEEAKSKTADSTLPYGLGA
jgi:phage anti-repressor protein